MTFDRYFSMPNSHTFKMAPVIELLKNYDVDQHWNQVVVDPFARDSRWANYANDLNPEFATPYQLDAIEFCQKLVKEDIKADIVLFDPPYSPRQISECYKIVGRKVGITDTQNARLYKEVRDRLDSILKPNGLAISFGWNSSGFGKVRGYEIEHIRLIPHGGAHNDTICVVERKAIRTESPPATPEN